MKILIVEDHPQLRENLIFLLKKHGHMGEWVQDGTEALKKLTHTKYNGILLDLEMPNMDGKTFMKELKKREHIPPVIVLTSFGQLEDKLDLFELGAQDYLTKPVEIEELIARMSIIAKRETWKTDSLSYQWNGIKLDTLEGKVYIDEESINLPRKQFLILEYLLRHVWHPQNKADIMEYVWWETEENLEFSSTTLESHIYALRKKLPKEMIQTLKGFGYVIE